MQRLRQLYYLACGVMLQSMIPIIAALNILGEWTEFWGCLSAIIEQITSHISLAN